MLDRLINFFTSLKLTVVLLCAATVLVLVGTLAQVHEGLYNAQNRFFKSWLVLWLQTGPDRRLPILLPGGYLIGTLLLINLIAAHLRRFQLTWKKLGIHLIHAGLIVLLLGQLTTDMFSTESSLQLFEGETKNYSEDFRANELALIDTTDPAENRVFAIPESFLARRRDIRDERLPVTLRVRNYWPNADLLRGETAGAHRTTATRGAYTNAFVLPRPRVTDSDARDLPAAEIEVLAGGESLGTWLVAAGLSGQQSFAHDGRTYELALRFTRYYKPFSITLLKATHEKYPGTEIPKNFASRVRVENPATHESRETQIYMNNPLRHGGFTFFQHQMLADDAARMKIAQQTGGAPPPPSSTFQVVANPSWLAPYVGCLIVGAGLTLQFMSHLVAFAAKRRAA
ncbi:MAG TPA: cytochrome c biogenesis protein ResB [Methylomirabilota bacterium]|nr:cytochrome c biogenesis protein ResB [Methylomirabilota bacterium]